MLETADTDSDRTHKKYTTNKLTYVSLTTRAVDPPTNLKLRHYEVTLN